MGSDAEDIADLESFASMDLPEADEVAGEIVNVGEDGPEPAAGAEVELMTVGEFKDVLRFGFDFPQTLSVIWGPLSIQPVEEGGFEAFAEALYSLLNRSDFTKKALMRSNSLFGEVIAVGSFAYMKIMVVKIILAEARAKPIEAQGERVVPSEAPEGAGGQYDGLKEQEGAG